MMRLAMALTKGLRKGTHQAWRTRVHGSHPSLSCKVLSRESKEQKAALHRPCPEEAPSVLAD